MSHGKRLWAERSSERKDNRWVTISKRKRCASINVRFSSRCSLFYSVFAFSLVVDIISREISSTRKVLTRDPYVAQITWQIEEEETQKSKCNSSELNEKKKKSEKNLLEFCCLTRAFMCRRRVFSSFSRFLYVFNGVHGGVFALLFIVHKCYDSA